MADDFGITLDPTYILQRHTLEDSDEEEAEKNADFVIVPGTSSRLDSRLIFAFGTPASIFANSYLKLENPPAHEIKSSHITVYKDKAFPVSDKEEIVVSEIFNVECREGSCSVCIHKSELKSVYCQEWCSLVCDLLQPKSVLMLTSLKSHQYFSSSSQDSAPSQFMKGLYSSSWEGPHTVNCLESPNTIIQEPAAVMTHCQLRGISAALLVSYTDSGLTTAECSCVFQPLLKEQFFSDIIHKSDREAEQQMRTILPKPSEDLSNLYS